MRAKFSCFSWVKDGDIRLADDLHVNNPVYVYVAKGGARWAVSGSIAGVEVLLKSELKNAQPPLELPDMFATLFPLPFAQYIDRYLIIDYKNASVDATMIHAPVLRTMRFLQPYLQKTGCQREGQDTVIRYYFLTRDGAIVENRFVFDGRWLLREMTVREVEHLTNFKYIAPAL